LRSYLGDERAGQQGTLRDKIKDKVLDMTLDSAIDWFIQNKASYAELAYAFCLALKDVLTSKGKKRKDRIENCVACLNRALRDAIEEQDAQDRSRKVVYSGESETGCHYAFHPNMVFGRAKYPRAV